MFFHFVILHHTGWSADGRGDHWDWLLDWPGRSESSAGLLSFAVATDPRAGWIDTWMTRLPPHRVDYLTFEGPVSGNRGAVRRVAVGNVFWKSMDHDELRFEVQHIDFGEVPFPSWPVAPYCLTHAGDPGQRRESWDSLARDSGPFWRLQLDDDLHTRPREAMDR